ncbi:MAG TPA: dynamin family protein, partial [Kineosporiaceae bacterium]
PLELCRPGVVLVDSPGLNEHVTRDKITLDRLGTADAVVFMQHAIAPMSTAEAQFLRTHLASHDPFFVFTYIDAVEPHEREEVTASARRRIVDVRGHDRDTRRMFFVDARAALRAREQHDDLAYRTSGITGLATALEAYLVTERHKVKVLSPARALRDVTRSLKGGVPHLLELLASDSQDLERRWEDAQGPLRALETEADRIGRDLRNQHLALEQRMAVLLSTCLTKVAAEAPSIAMTVAPDTRLTLVPWNVKARAEQAAKEIAVAVGEEIERRITDWTVSTLEPLVATELAQIAVRTDTQLATFETHLSALRISLSGVGEAALVGQGQEEATMTRALAGGMGFLLGGVAGGLVGARLGPKEALRTLLPSILLYLAWLVTPWGLPTLIAGAVIQAVWQGTKGTQRVATRMREAIGREMSTQILQQAPTLAADAARKFAATSTAPIQQAVDGAMRARIAQVSADVDDARRAQEQGEAAITARRADLRATADRLGDLESRIEDLIGDVEIL